MPYRIPAINQAAIEDAREVAAFGEGLRRQRNDMVRRVLGACVIGVGVVLIASAHVMSGAPFTDIGTTSSCTEDTCLCWLEEHHTWARFDCEPEPAGTCFRSYGTCR